MFRLTFIWQYKRNNVPFPAELDTETELKSSVDINSIKIAFGNSNKAENTYKQ